MLVLGLTGCSGGPGAPGTGDAGSPGSLGKGGSTGLAGSPATTGGSGGSPGSQGGSGPGLPPAAACTPGIPVTSQVPRLTTLQYDSIMKDLLGVTALASNGNKPPSTLLVPDFPGDITAVAWDAYQSAAETIAAEVMAGTNRSRFITCDPAAASCLSDTIRLFGRKLFRRPITDAEVAGFMRFNSLGPALTADQVAESILFAMLASPSFIMVPELAQTKEGDYYRLNSW